MIVDTFFADIQLPQDVIKTPEIFSKVSSDHIQYTFSYQVLSAIYAWNVETK